MTGATVGAPWGKAWPPLCTVLHFLAREYIGSVCFGFFLLLLYTLSFGAKFSFSCEVLFLACMPVTIIICSFFPSTNENPLGVHIRLLGLKVCVLKGV